MKTIDYSKFSTQGELKTPGITDKRWWLLPKDELPHALSTIVHTLGQSDSKRQTQYQISTRLYGNTNLMGVNGLSFSKITSVQNALKDRLSYNIVQSGIDTVTAKMAKNKPKPMFLTSGGSWNLQARAKKLNKFCEGIFYENKAHFMGIDAFRDGAVLGDGIIHVFDYHNRVRWERVMPSELYVDPIEAFDGNARQMHRVKNVDRQILIDMFPEKKNKIMEANSASADMIATYQNVSDVVTVCESWHLPSGPDAKDGIHVITLENDLLFTEDWTKQYFPFAKFTWGKRLYGFWGQGAAEQIQNIQLEINKLLWVKQRSLHLAGSFKIFLENGSKVVKEHLNNDIGAIVTYTGVKPEYVIPPVIPMEIDTQINWLKQAGYEQLGISMLSAASQKPAGLNSGKALREYNDIESDRFMVIGQLWEQFFLDIARLSIDVAKDIAEREGGYRVDVPGRGFLKTIDWKDIDLEDDEYVMKMFPVSSLPQEPAGRLQTVQEYVQAGFISPRTAKRLLDFPDLEAVENLENAAEDYLNDIFDKITNDGEYTPPDQFDDLQLAEQICLEYIQQGKLNNLEEDKLMLLIKFLSQVRAITQKAQQAMQPPQGAPGMQPQAQPQAPPTSDMVQNQPGLQGVA
jgi:hypothetical protein